MAHDSHPAAAVRVLTWNVAGRLSRLDEQARRVFAHEPDAVCLQEVIPRALPRWAERLRRGGYETVASAVDPAAGRVHRLGVLVAARHPLTTAAAPPAVPWPERMLAADVRPPGWPRPLHVVCLHAPLSQRPELVKVRTLDERLIVGGPPGWRDAFRALRGDAARDRS